jgi:acetyl-CoA acetyltransferase
MSHPMKGAAAICGLGITEMGRVYRDAEDLAAEAVHLALADAGLPKSELDGLLINAGVSNSVSIPLHITLGLRELNVLTFMQGYGSTAGQMIQYAAMAVANGLANYICCVFADDPLKEGVRTGAAYARAGRPDAMTSLFPIYGFAGALPMYALAAQRHMDLFGTTQEQLASVAIQQRQWAGMNERATKREPLDLDGYNASPWVVQPFHVLDCCLVSNGGVAVIVTTPERGARPQAAGGVRAGLRPGAQPRRRPRRARSADPRPGRQGRAACAGNGRRHPGRRHPVPDLRLLHVHRHHHPGGLRVLPEGRRRRVRGRRPPRPGRRAAPPTPAAASCRRSTCGA